eukprot:TRINITY_DN7098_c0_g1_i2.p1 TRINITY_DN7098_c0_g1~~TRINITY_DN7098_c0_g1_i2.p1  ORF type:complete len:213 (+),score=65.02 TRINITY_DN7098_c0_g1_i2:41-640(+)
MSIKQLAKEVNKDVDAEEEDDDDDEDEDDDDIDEEHYDEPSMILDHLYLGGNVAARDETLLERLKIKNVVNLASHPMYPVTYDSTFKVLSVAARDQEDYPIIPMHFESIYDFIEDKFSKGQKILVHCQYGASRSPTIVICYLMKKYGWGFKKAYDFVLKRRCIIEPNEGFVKQLKAYDKANNNSFTTTTSSTATTTSKK